MWSKMRTSVRRWIHGSGRRPSCSDFCNSVDVIVMYHLELIFVLCQGSYKLGECRPYQTWMQKTPLAGLILILSKMFRGIMHTQLKWTAVLQTKILPETWFDPERMGNHKTGSNRLQYKYIAKIWKIKQQSFREHCVFTAGTRVLRHSEYHENLNTWKSPWWVSCFIWMPQRS